MKSNYKDLLVNRKTPLPEAAKIIEKGALGIALIVDDEGKLVGVLTDVDIRIAFLKGEPMNLSVEHYMNANPVTIQNNVSWKEHEAIKEKFPSKRFIPVVDQNGRVVGIETTRMAAAVFSNPVIVLAGGLGQRLLPLTENTPKPMLKIKDRPILEIMLKHLGAFGFRNIIISVNYHGNQIKEHFRDGSDLGLNISYLEEKIQLGTAGSLSLAGKIEEPCIVVNGDILSKVDFRKFLDFHIGSGHDFTVALIEYSFEVPFGVATIDIDGQTLVGIEEKPVKKFFVNAGMYIMNPEVQALIPRDCRYDMTQLIDTLLKSKRKVGCFPIREYWIDVGQHASYHKANADYSYIFEE